MTRTQLLETATAIVDGRRDGTAEDSFRTIAGMWSAYLGVPVAPVDVCAMMVMLKVGRVRHGRSTEDSLVDIAGYAACAVEYVAPKDTEVAE